MLLTFVKQNKFESLFSFVYLCNIIDYNYELTITAVPQC